MAQPVRASIPNVQIIRHRILVGSRPICSTVSSQAKRILQITGNLLLSSTLLGCGPTHAELAPAALDAAYQELPPIPTKFPPLADIKELPLREVTLSNGLRVFLIEDHEVPLVKGSIAMRGGTRASPPDKVGLASIAVAVQRSGGSVSHPAEVMNESLEQIAAGIEGGALPEAIVVGFECLKEDTSRVVSLLSELLTSPACPEEKLQLYKAQVLNLLEHQNDNTSAIPRRELSKLVYGRDSVFARSPTEPGVRSIDRADVQQYIRRWERPDGAVMGVVGDFDSSEMVSLLENGLRDWRGLSDEAPQRLPVSPLPQSREEEKPPPLHLVNIPGATQASVAMGEVGISLSDPDAPALDVLNEIFNSFGGSLFNELRSREGLAYSVSGGFDTNAVDHPGLFIAGGETAVVADFIAALERILQDATEVAPSQKILDAAKARTLNSFVFNFSSAEAQLQRVIGFSLLGLPQDYLFSYRDKIQAVTPEDVLRAARKHLHPRQLEVVVAADAAANRAQLQKQGRDIVEIEIGRGEYDGGI